MLLTLWLLQWGKSASSIREWILLTLSVDAEGSADDSHSEPNCPPTHDSLCLGSKVESIIRKTLPKRYQGSIMSAECNKL
jgi:hypothetical protein